MVCDSRKSRKELQQLVPPRIYGVDVVAKATTDKDSELKYRLYGGTFYMDRVIALLRFD